MSSYFDQTTQIYRQMRLHARISYSVNAASPCFTEPGLLFECLRKSELLFDSSDLLHKDLSPDSINWTHSSSEDWTRRC
jgi:hypothetical protein